MPYDDFSRLLGHNKHYFYFPLETFLAQQRALGLERINLWACAPHILLDHHHPPQPQSVLSLLRRYHLTPSIFTVECSSYRYTLASADPERRRRSLSYFVHCIQYAAALSCRVLCLPVNGRLLDRPVSEAWQWAREGILWLQSQAAAHDMSLMLLAEPNDPTNLFQSPEEMAHLRQALGSQCPDLAVDLSSIWQSPMGAQPWLAAAGPSLGHVFLSGVKQGARHVSFEKSEVSLRQMLRALEKIGYAGEYTLLLDDYPDYLAPQQTDQRNLAALIAQKEDL